MRRFCTPLLRGAGVVCGLLLAASLHAQSTGRAATGKVNRMEINNGLTQTVRYHGQSLSPGEESTLREMERAENEMLYVRNLEELKKQYVIGERIEETNRRYVQHLLYGQNFFQSYGPWGFVGPVNATFGGFGGFGVGGFPYGAYAAYGNNLYSGGIGFGGYGGSAYGTSRTLAVGVGDEGRLKTAMSPVIASQATPEYAAAALQAYDQVSARMADSPVLAKALPNPNGLVLANAEQPSVRLTLKDGDKIEGFGLTETKDWYILKSVTGNRVNQTRVRQSEVVRIETGQLKTPSGIRPAVSETPRKKK
jgi:hypothetical protein